SHTATGNLTLDDVPFAVLGLATEQFLDRLLAGSGGERCQRDATFQARLSDTAGRAVDLFLGNERLRRVERRHGQGQLAGRAGGLAAGELGLDLELLAAGAGEGDHRSLKIGPGTNRPTACDWEEANFHQVTKKTTRR